MARRWALAVACWASWAGTAAAATQSWGDLTAAAQREGKVVVAAPAHPEVRQALPAAFKARFGINLEYIGAPASASVAKLHAERLAGIYSLDVTLAGIQTVATIFYRDGLLDPIKPLLVLPEVLDGSKWKKGSLWFVDPERQYVLRLFSPSPVWARSGFQVRDPTWWAGAERRGEFLFREWAGHFFFANGLADGGGRGPGGATGRAAGSGVGASPPPGAQPH